MNRTFLLLISRIPNHSSALQNYLQPSCWDFAPCVCVWCVCVCIRVFVCVCLCVCVWINQPLIEESLWMIVDKIWKLTNTVRVGLSPQSSHWQKQDTFPDNVCSYSPPVTLPMKIWLLFFSLIFFKPQETILALALSLNNKQETWDARAMGKRAGVRIRERL